jgi:hypothetical protein
MSKKKMIYLIKFYIDEGDVVDKLYIIKRTAAIRKQAGSASKVEEKNRVSMCNGTL